MASSLSLALGCAAPRVQVTGPLVDTSGSIASIARARALPQASARSLPPATALRPARNASGNSHATPGLDESVARYIARPELLFDPATSIRRWRYIVLHHSAADTGSLASIDRYHREVRGWDECGYHFVIGNGTESGDGEIEVGPRWLKQKHGAHTKNVDHPEYNDEGIGVCLVGDFNAGSPTPKQVEACRRLVAYLEERCDVTPACVTTHGYLAGNHTECPGRNFPFQTIVAPYRFTSR